MYCLEGAILPEDSHIVPETKAPQGVRDLLDWIASRTGLDFQKTSASHAAQTVAEAMQSDGVSHGNEYRALLTRDRSVYDRLVGRLTVGETYFFRDPAQFQFITDVLLPEFQEEFGRHRKMSIWSAGCASGEEPYSIAMAFDEIGQLGNVKILGTDLSTEALERARAAEYRQWSMRGNAERRVARHSESTPRGIRLKEHIRNAVTFRKLNLTRESEAGSIQDVDLILCRNVLIYFDRSTITNVVQTLTRSLSPHGWLLTAGTDPPLEDVGELDLVSTEAGVAYRKSTPSPNIEEWNGFEPDSSPTESPEQRTTALSERERTPHVSSIEVERAAAQSMANGDYSRVMELTQHVVAQSESCAALLVRAASNIDTELAEKECAAAVAVHRVGVELHHLHSLLLLGLGRCPEALAAAKRVLYLSPENIYGHFTIAAIHERLGDQASARRAYATAKEFCDQMEDDDTVPFSEGQTAASLARQAERRLERLGDSRGLRIED